MKPLTLVTLSTSAGKALRDDPNIDLDGYGYVLPDDWAERIVAIEAEAAATAQAQAAMLREALKVAREAVESWAGYASDYFREKWDFDGDLAAIDAALSDSADVDAWLEGVKREAVKAVLVRLKEYGRHYRPDQPRRGGSRPHIKAMIDQEPLVPSAQALLDDIRLFRANQLTSAPLDYEARLRDVQREAIRGARCRCPHDDGCELDALTPAQGESDA